MLADEECVESRGSQAREIGMRLKPDSTHCHTFIRNRLDQLFRCFNAHFERAQIAIVHAQNASPAVKARTSSSRSMYFDERLHSQFAAERQQLEQHLILEARDNQQEGVSIRRPRFPHLPRIDNEILAQHRQADRPRAHRAYILDRPEKILPPSAQRALLLRPLPNPWLAIRGWKSARIRPREGDAFLSSAITFRESRVSAAAKSRTGLACFTP